MRRNLPLSGKTQRVSGTCGFLGSSLASSFLPLQLFFGTWQNAHLKSCLRSGSVELRIERKAQNKEKTKQQFKQLEMIKSPSGVLSDESMQAHSTFDVVYDWDYVLVEQLGGAAAELCWLNVLENGAKFHIFLTEWVAAEGRAENKKTRFKRCNTAWKQKCRWIRSRDANYQLIH